MLKNKTDEDSCASFDIRIIEDAAIGSIYYPVGSFMQENMPKIFYMAELLGELLEDFMINQSDVCLVSQGSSGSIVSALIASKMPGSIIWDIKKPDINSHSHHDNCVPPAGKYLVFVDDFISSGRTFRRCCDEVMRNNRKINCVVVSNSLTSCIFENHHIEAIICESYNGDPGPLDKYVVTSRSKLNLP